jgi:hypothetical protein
VGMKRKEKTAGSGRRVAAGRRGRERVQRCSMAGAGSREVRARRCKIPIVPVRRRRWWWICRGRSGERRRAGGRELGEVGMGGGSSTGEERDVEVWRRWG